MKAPGAPPKPVSTKQVGFSSDLTKTLQCLFAVFYATSGFRAWRSPCNSYPNGLASSYESQNIDIYKYIDSDATLGQSLVQTTSSGRAKSLLELEPNSIPNPARKCIGGLREVCGLLPGVQGTLLKRRVGITLVACGLWLANE